MAGEKPEEQPERVKQNGMNSPFLHDHTYFVTSLREAQAAFEKAALTHQASGQARRAAARFDLVGAAGEFATEWGIPDGMQARA